jgi:hypothetical protein
LFWKKKSDKPEGKSLFKVPEQSRGAFRVAPAAEEPVILKISGVAVPVIDISSGGVSFKNINFKVGVSYDITLLLPYSLAPITTKLKIIKITDDKTCPAVFLDLEPEFEDEIHHYVLLRQKEELKNKKNIYM